MPRTRPAPHPSLSQSTPATPTPRTIPAPCVECVGSTGREQKRAGSLWHRSPEGDDSAAPPTAARRSPADPAAPPAASTHRPSAPSCGYARCGYCHARSPLPDPGAPPSPHPAYALPTAAAVPRATRRFGTPSPHPSPQASRPTSHR